MISCRLQKFGTGNIIVARLHIIAGYIYACALMYPAVSVCILAGSFYSSRAADLLIFKEWLFPGFVFKVGFGFWLKTAVTQKGVDGWSLAAELDI